ncbi:hypothetical protein FSARC_9192 [Fusarium sarcochroum]|uniref:NACHT domain-containing protein n=1 Tax=Fusarium sarcochroum TaxID=1208366 RepID=A0A8H4TRX2_9HYPO|nr:hypothetical protein FSARC_9192 [Fusarium sarcochroum]
MENLFTTVGLVPQLKAEVRLAQAISEFSGSLNTDKDRVKFKNLQSQSPPGSDKIIKLTEEINRDGARLHPSWRPYGTRLIAILERIRQFAPIGDVLMGGSQNMIACGVWAVVRLSLEASTSLTFLSYFENVTSLMLNIARSLSLHKDFSMLFPDCQKLQTYMCEYTIILVRICTKVVANCGKSVLSQLASSLAYSFDSVFKPLESELITWGQMIEKRTTLLLAKASLRSQATVLERFNRLKTTSSQERARILKEDRKHRLLNALCPIQNEVDLIWRRERKNGTSTWMNNHDLYQTWLHSNPSSVMWLKGNLGSGKTVTMASVVAQLASSPLSLREKVSFFFCRAENPKTLLASTLLGSIAAQVLQSPALESALTSFLVDTEISPNICARIDDCVGILLKATPSDWRGFLILDGIDECSLEEAGEICIQLQRLLQSRRVRVLISSRPTSPCYWSAISILKVSATLNMESVDRANDIRAYFTAEVARWNRIRQLPSGLARLAEEQLLAGCQGMFLWLSLQVEDICPKHTRDLRPDAEILMILENLPKSLPEAFDRALTRIQDETFGSKILKLVAAAERNLTADELRVAANVKPGDRVWHASMLIDSGETLLSRYGGCLLDLDEEDSLIRFIHYSVLLHIPGAPVDPRAAAFHFNLSEAQNMMGSVCVTYLNYALFETRISIGQKVSFGQIPEKMAHRETDIKVDLEKLSYDLSNQKWEDTSEAHLFLDYARKYWLAATRDILGHVEQGICLLWKFLVTGSIVSTSLPWNAGVVTDAATWAIENDHRSLFQFFLHSDNQDDVLDVLTAAEACVASKASTFLLTGKDLGLLVPIYLTSTRKNLLALKAFIDLGCHPLRLEGSRLAWYHGDVRSGFDDSVRSTVVKILKDSKPDHDVAMTVVPFLFNYMSGPDEILDNGWTALHICIQHRHKILASQFLSMGADVNGCLLSGRPTPLQLSLKQGLVELAKTLIRAGADTLKNPDGQLPPMLLALGIAELHLFYELFSRGAYESKAWYGNDGKWYTAFQFACLAFCRGPRSSLGHVDTVLKKLLIDGADINLRSSEGETPLILSSRTKKLPLTQTLFALGADPNTTTPGGLSPLMIAACRGDPALVEYLLDNGADLNLRLVENISTNDARILNHTERPTREDLGFADGCWSDLTTKGWSALTLSMMTLTRIIRQVERAKEALHQENLVKTGDDEDYQKAYEFALLSNECRPLGYIVRELLSLGAERLPCDQQVADLLGIDKFVEADCDEIVTKLEEKGVQIRWR